MTRVPTSVLTRNAIREMLSGKNESFEVSDFVRQAVRLLIEEALEAEVGERLGGQVFFLLEISEWDVW